VITTPAADPMPKSFGTFALSTIGLVVAVLTLPIVIVAGGPIQGWVLGLLLWSANWGASLWLAKASKGMSAPYAVGLSGASFIARAWMVAIVLFVVALTYDKTVGLVAAGVFLAAFTFDLVGRTALFAARHKQQEGSAQ
jgi:hypothetical protein